MIDIKGYEDRYAVDEDGNVWSLNYRRSGKMKKLKPCVTNKGYLMVCLYKDGKGKSLKIHRLMAEAFLPDFSEELQVDHIDRDKQNNNLSNLRMVTNAQNQWNQDSKGCSWFKPRQKWVAYITKDGKQHHLGYFLKEEDAHQAYLDAKEIYHTM